MFGWSLATVIVPLLVGSLVLLYVQARHEQRTSQHQLRVLARTLVAALERELDIEREQLQVLAAAPMVDSEEWRQLHAFAVRVAQRDPGSVIGLTGPDGQQIFNSVTSLDAPQPNLWQLGRQQKEVEWEGRTLPLSSQLLSKQVFERREVAYSDLYYGLNTRHPALAVSVPVVRDGQVRYALTLSFRPERLGRLVESAVVEPGLRAVIADRRGIVVAANSAAASRLADRITPISTPSGSLAGTYDGTSRDGTSVRGAYAVSTKNGYVVRVSRPRESVADFLRSSTAGWVILVMAALGASIYMAAGLARRIGQPLRALGQAASSGSEPTLGETKANIMEIRVLAQALKLGADAEQHRREALIREAKRAEAELALRRADRQKDEFLATLAHELRNPLAPVRSGVFILRHRTADGASKRILDVMERQLQQLVRLLDDLLDVARISSGKMALRTELTSLATVVAAAKEATHDLLQTRKQRVLQEGPFDGVLLRADPVRLAQVITNLLTNAAHHSPAASDIKVAVRCDEDKVVVSVMDTGIGITADRLGSIFEMFATTGARSGDGSHAGLGIGLGLSRKIVEMHGGRIWAESDGPGRGASVHVQLPRVQNS
ncbi:sensor histidine kinase [Ramlibacter sp. AN1015]|uniref:sensor histidine kinase n=1 Tax=Ramlibacter sp. AN1015 TaxID=3133428 RepID=UPI0030C52734